MKSIKISILLLFVSINTFGQWTTSGSGHAYNTNSSGWVGIGTSTPATTFHVHGSGTNGPSIFLTGVNGANTPRLTLGIASCNGCYSTFATPGDKVIRNNGGDDLIIVTDNSGSALRLGTSSVERMTLLDNGFLGIGNTSPSSLLHLSHSSPKIFLDGTGNYGASTLSLGRGGASSFDINTSIYPWCGSPTVTIGPSAANTKKIFFPSANSSSNKIIFGANSTFGFGNLCGSNQPGISGRYLFDDQVGATSLMVMPPITASTYTPIPTGYIFSVQGNSNLNGRLQVNNETSTAPDNSIAGLNISNATDYSWIQTADTKPLALNPLATSTNNNYVAIGFDPTDPNITVPSGYKLAIDGKVICTELKVKASGNWPDYVFSDTYNLLPLDSVAHYVSVNKHLPEVPSAEEVEKEGINTGEMDQILLKKIEELTLYMIEQKKAIDELKAENKELQKKVETLEEID